MIGIRNKSRIGIILAIAALASVTGACGSSAPVHYYSLSGIDSGYNRDAAGAAAIGIGPIRTPDYLSRPRIVTRGADGEMVIDDFNRWVEPVDEAIHRIVAGNVDILVDDAFAVSFPYRNGAELDYQVIGRISRFDAAADGSVVLEVQWGVTDDNGKFVAPMRRARYEAHARGTTDYAAVAGAMSDTLQQFSRDIAGEIRGLRR